MVTGGGHRFRSVAKNSLAVMFDLADLAVHDLPSPHNLASEGCADGLMSQAHAKYGRLPCKIPDQVNADTGLLWGTRAGRDQNVIGVKLLNLFRRDLVIAAHFHSLSQLTQVLD